MNLRASSEASPPQAKLIIMVIGMLSLFTAGVSASLRAAIANDLKRGYLDSLDLAHSATMIATALGLAFLGFTVMLIVTSLLLDRIGMKSMLRFGALMFIVGTILVIGCGAAGHGVAVYWLIMLGMFLNGLGHGSVEGVLNPMIGSLYPEGTTARMNMLHAWWPAGLIAGGVFGAFGAYIGLDWRVLFAAVAVCALVFGGMTFGREFPQTRSGSLGMSVKDQIVACLRQPTFFIWFFLMIWTSAAELAPSQWLDVALSNVVGMRGILLVVYLAVIEFVVRHFAGPVEKALSTEGLLTGSCVLAALGLYLLGSANSPATAIGASTLWGVGVSLLWPTMLAVTAERYPRGGNIAIGLIGVAGSFSTYALLPLLGGIYDSAKLRAAGGSDALAKLNPQEMKPVLVYAAGESFRGVALIPALLTAAFAVMWFLRRHHIRGQIPAVSPPNV